MIDREALWAMQVFVAVVEGGSLAAAARSLRVTPSAVSKQLGKLERRMHVRLLQRSTRALRTTAAGERYRAHAKSILSAVEAAECDTQAREEAIAGSLRVSAPTVLGQEVVAPIVAAFVARHRDVQIELDLTDRFVDLGTEPVDVAIRVASRLPESRLTARRLGALTWILVASPAYLEARGKPSRAEDLATHACLDLAHAADRGRWRLQMRERSVEVEVTGPLVSSSLIALHRCALAGVGIAQLPSYLVRADVAAGRLVQVLSTAGAERRTVWAVQPTRAFVPARVRAFVDFVASSMPGALDPSKPKGRART